MSESTSRHAPDGHRINSVPVQHFVVAAVILILAVLPARAAGTIIDFATQAPGLLITGAAANEALGADLVLGDLDGDGVDDLAIGAPWAPGPDNRSLAGRVYVFFGGTERPAQLSAEEADVIIYGVEAGDETGGGATPSLGFSTLAIGDLNDDEFDDLVIGVPEAAGSGAVRVVFGRTRAGWEAAPTLDLAGETDVLITAADAFDKLGTSVAVGDLNGDGVGDLVAGAPLADWPGDNRLSAGKVYAFWGRPTWGDEVAADDADLEVVGAQRNDFLGSGLAVGQLDGAGPLDVAMGAVGGEGGEVHVLFGAPDLGGTRDLAATPADWIVLAADAVDGVGRYLAAGDVSGDGQPDLVIGVPAGNGPTNARTDAGEVAVIFGPATAGLSDLGTDADVTVYGPAAPGEAGNRLGGSIALGDLNHDGVLDLIAAARQGDGAGDSRFNAGEAYVVFGGDLPVSIDLETESADVTLYGEDAEDGLGFVGSGDFDAIPGDDLALGVYLADVRNGQTLTRAGKVYVVYRQTVGPTPTATPSPTPGTPTPALTVTPTPTGTPEVVPRGYLPLILRQ